MSPVVSRPRIAVIGAGPAGSTAARLLASGGADVRLFEARHLPRPKVCGGGLTPKAQRLVPASALETVERWVDRVELRAPHLAPTRLVAPGATIAMVERARFDLALVEEAALAGATIRDDEPVRDLVEDDSGVEVITRRERWRADVVVAADGSPSRAAHQTGLGGRARRMALALEIDVPLRGGASPDGAILDFGVASGYGWYFPKGDHANLGVGSHRAARFARLREDLVRLADSLGVDTGPGRIQGHWIPTGLGRGALASRRVVLAGDAAATADALFGEGISYAILAGVAAAQTIGDWAGGSIADLRVYDRRLRSVLGPPLGWLDTISRAAETSITMALLAIRLSAWVRERAIDAIAGRTAPFAIDSHCEVACTCDVHAATPAGAGFLLTPMAVGHRHCASCSTACAA